jgi:hypothetical protein
MKNASFSFMVSVENYNTPFTTDKCPVISAGNEKIYSPVINLSAENLEEIREQAHRIVDNTVDVALNGEPTC